MEKNALRYLRSKKNSSITSWGIRRRAKANTESSSAMKKKELERAIATERAERTKRCHESLPTAIPTI